MLIVKVLIQCELCSLSFRRKSVLEQAGKNHKSWSNPHNKLYTSRITSDLLLRDYFVHCTCSICFHWNTKKRSDILIALFVYIFCSHHKQESSSTVSIMATSSEESLLPDILTASSYTILTAAVLCLILYDLYCRGSDQLNGRTVSLFRLWPKWSLIRIRIILQCCYSEKNVIEHYGLRSFTIHLNYHSNYIKPSFNSRSTCIVLYILFYNTSERLTSIVLYIILQYFWLNHQCNTKSA